jgi:hypothetical protein
MAQTQTRNQGYSGAAHDIKEKATDQFERMADKATDQFKSAAEQAEGSADGDARGRGSAGLRSRRIVEVVSLSGLSGRFLIEGHRPCFEA